MIVLFLVRTAYHHNWRGSLALRNHDLWWFVRAITRFRTITTLTPESARMPLAGKETRMVKLETQDRVAFETGSLSREEIEGMLDSLPVDITFVDKEDRVRYFNQSKDRFFPRARAIIGRTVQLCHPQKSVHIVNGIVEGFRDGSRDVAEFWINLQGNLVHIRYFAVRDRGGGYLGTLEVTQDITDLKKLEGERRLLDDTRA